MKKPWAPTEEEMMAAGEEAANMAAQPPQQSTHILSLMTAWNEMDGAAQNVMAALPSQMTEAVARLDKARLAMRAAVLRSAQAHANGEPHGGA